MSPKWTVVVVGLLALVAIFGGGFGVGYGLRAAQDAKGVATAQGDFSTCKVTADVQTGALTKISKHTADEKAKADALLDQAAAQLKTRAPAMAAIDARAKRDVDAIRNQGHENADGAALARLAVPPAVARRLWPGAAASAGATANR